MFNINTRKGPIGLLAIFALLALMCVTATANPKTPTKPVEPPPPVVVEPDCTTQDCVFTPAMPTVTVLVPGSTTTTEVVKETFTYSEIRTALATYQRETNTIVAISWSPEGIESSKGCVDPVKKGWIKAGGKYQNSGVNTGFFGAKWVKGLEICDFRVVTINGAKFLVGRKSNCDNRIRIPLNAKAKKQVKVTKRSVEMSSYSEFVEIWMQYSRETTTTTVVTEPITETTWSCPVDAAMVNINGAIMCQTCPPPVCVCPEGTEQVGKGCHPIEKTPVVCPKGSSFTGGKCTPDCPPKGKNVKSWTKSKDNTDCPPKGTKGGKSTTKV